VSDPGAYGKRTPKRHPAVQFASVFTGVIPNMPSSRPGVDHLQPFTAWQMLGNDRAADCVSVMWANTRRVVSTTIGTAEYPTQDMVWAFYRTQNPGFNPNGDPSVDGPGSSADQGMDIQTACEDLHKNGGPDGTKMVGFAQVDHTSLQEVKAAIALAGAVFVGTQVNANNEAEFSASEPWTYDRNSPNVGGHGICTAGYGYGGTGLEGRDFKFVTWAEETSFSDGLLLNQVDEVWLPIWPEHMQHGPFLEGVSMSQFAADYQTITGRPFPAS
jgi:hypothetical protein